MRAMTPVVKRMSGGRLFGVVALGDGEDQPVALDGVLDGAQRAGSPGRNRCGDAGEHDRPAKWQDGESLALAHVERSCRKRIDAHQSGTFHTIGFTPSRQGLQLFPDRLT